MFKNKRKIKLLLLYTFSTLGLVWLVTSMNMKFMYENLHEYDNRVFAKIKEQVIQGLSIHWTRISMWCHVIVVPYKWLVISM